VVAGSPCSAQAGALAVAVGDLVVYARHGVGRVVARERSLVAGTERDCVVVELAACLRVTLPADVAAARLRAVMSDAEFADVRRTLAQRPADRHGLWTRRIKEHKAKLARGRVSDLAELVRDGARYERVGECSRRLSFGERRLYLDARRLLVCEICSARGIEQAEAEEWIEAQIALPERKRDRQADGANDSRRDNEGFR
jgi:CarD family transcriptional regulator